MNKEIEPVAKSPSRDAAVLIAAGAALGDAKQHTDKETLPYMVIPDGYKSEVLARLDRPVRTSGTTQMSDARSFSDLYGRFAADSLIYASLNPAQFIAVLNDHKEEGPDWRDHRIVFQPKHSDPWNAWMKRNGADKAFNLHIGNVEFAEWLEDQALDIVQPTGAAMLHMALSFKATESAQFSNAANLQDGSVTFDYQRTVQGSAIGPGGGKCKIPERFTILIPVFDGPDEPKYKIEARFRYRLVGGGLRIWYQLERPNLVMEAAFKDLWKKIEKETGASILYGRPD